MKLLAERHSGRVLGGQIVGLEGAAKRIDVIATVPHRGMGAEEMTALDLSYAPALRAGVARSGLIGGAAAELVAKENQP